MASFLIVPPPLALSNVAILEPPTRKSWLFHGLAVGFGSTIEPLIESIDILSVTVKVPPPEPDIVV